MKHLEKLKIKVVTILKQKFFEIINNNKIDIASGERKQYNESMKEEVEKNNWNGL